ncbi:MAG: immunoglobulin domain-containing protein [Verrucomicrobiales bacterium]
MKPSDRIRPFVFILALAVASIPFAVDGAPIPGLFNTGVGEDGKLLAASGAVDPHYTMIVSPDEEFTGPDLVTLNPGFPVGPWLEEGPDSKWIVANPESGNSAEGDYTYRTTFDLTGFDPAKATITGRWAVDNTGIDILINGESLGITNGAGFASWSDFTIDSGFVEGENVLEFIFNNAPASPNPAGLRVELRGTVEVAGEAPSILKQPESKNIFQGEPATFTVDADGSPPLTYQWFKGDDEIDGATSAELTIDAVALEDGADYSVVVSNGVGSTPSDKARLAVVQALTGLFNTGIGDDGKPIEDFEIDPHYILVVNPNEESADAIVEDTSIWPIVAGPWLLPSDSSKWIGPVADTNGVPGDYHYRFTFDLTGFDPETAFVSGNWSSDNAASDILINGVATGKGNGGDFGNYVEFHIEDGFVEGENTLEFIVNNAGDAVGPTGLRIDNFRGGAVAVDVPTQVVTQPRSATVFENDDVQVTVVATWHSASFLPVALCRKRNRRCNLRHANACCHPAGPGGRLRCDHYRWPGRGHQRCSHPDSALKDSWRLQHGCRR